MGFFKRGSGGKGLATEPQQKQIIWVDEQTVTLEPGQSYHIGNATSVILPAVMEAESQPIKLARDWGSVSSEAELTLQGSDQLINLFPSKGDEAVDLWPYNSPDSSIVGWVVLAAARG